MPELINLTPILTGLITLCLLVLTVLIIPGLKSRSNSDKYQEAVSKLDTITSYARVVCNAMEQMFPGQGTKKLEEATSRIHSMLEANNLTYDAEEIRTAIEAAVKEINKAIHD